MFQIWTDKAKFYLLFGRRGGQRRRGSGWDAIYVLVLVSTFGPTYCKQNCLFVLLFNYCDIFVSNMLLWESKVKTETVPRRGGSSETVFGTKRSDIFGVVDATWKIYKTTAGANFQRKTEFTQPEKSANDAPPKDFGLNLI